MATRFEIFLFSPDGDFTGEEVQDLIRLGFKWKAEKEKVFFRLSPVEVTEIEETTPEKYYTMKDSKI